jgi:multiple sugar transport system substrate-binding protein
MRKQINFIFAAFAITALLLSACGGAATTAAPQATTAPEQPPASGVTELTILWAEWDPANYLQQLGAEYEKQTGVKINVIQEPWPTFGNRFATEMAGKGSSYDMVVGDSQWLGQGSTDGWYVELTPHWAGLNGAGLAPATVTAYAEYPKGSGKYWAYPAEGDAPGWAYRKDLFENPDEMAAFEAKYGYALAVPTTWAQLGDIAEFFTRPDANLYGVGIYTQKGGDAITMGFENVLFSWGADWGDQATYKVDGVLNSPEAIESLEFYKKLYSLSPPGSSDDFFQEVNNHFTSGQIAMGLNYFAFLPALVNEASNPYAASTGYFANPAGPTGLRHAALGGQGISIVKYISDERQQAAMDFIEWFGKNETQQLWADLGGYTCNLAVLESDKFLNATPYNRAFSESMTFVKDFWAVPVYAEMLTDSQEALHTYVVAGEGTAKDTLDALTVKHEATLRTAGFLK